MRLTTPSPHKEGFASDSVSHCNTLNKKGGNKETWEYRTATQTNKLQFTAQYYTTQKKVGGEKENWEEKGNGHDSD